MRLAHFSDIHVALPPHVHPRELTQLKPLLGAVNYYFGGRARHFAKVDERIARLLQDADAQSTDHVLCTGDISLTSLDAELARCAELYGERLRRPERYTVIPGNHDRYTRAAVEERRFERRFDALSGGSGEHPRVKRIGDRITLVLLDVSRPTLVDSSGLCGTQQLRRLADILTDRRLASDFVILALHYGLLRERGQPDHFTHRLRDFDQLIALIDRQDVHLDLVLHGHLHQSYSVRTERRMVICAGSATDLAFRCGYNVYDIDVEQKRFTIERRVWRKAEGAYRSVTSDSDSLSRSARAEHAPG
jgi:3',5'-cyclic AMP phosphodiesterase CpdA